MNQNDVFSGKQITKLDGYSQPENGFVVGLTSHQGQGAFCRFFRPDSNELRTLSNSENTKLEYLHECLEPRDQTIVDLLCCNILLHHGPIVPINYNPQPNQVFVLYLRTGPNYNPPNPDLTIPVHHNTSGHYVYKPQGHECRHFILARLGHAKDFAAYQGFAEIDMPLTKALEAIVRFGDKIRQHQAENHIKRLGLARIFEGLNY